MEKYISSDGKDTGLYILKNWSVWKLLTELEAKKKFSPDSVPVFVINKNDNTDSIIKTQKEFDIFNSEEEIFAEHVKNDYEYFNVKE